MKKIAVNVPDPQVEFLQKTAESRDVTITEVVCDAIKLEEWVADAMANGARLLIERDGQIRMLGCGVILARPFRERHCFTTRTAGPRFLGGIVLSTIALVAIAQSSPKATTRSKRCWRLRGNTSRM